MTRFVNIRTRAGEFVLDVLLFVCLIYWKAVLLAALVVPPLLIGYFVMWVFGVF